MLAHLTGYPLAFLWAVASIPLAIHVFIRDLEALNDDMPAIGNFVVHRLAWPAGAAFVLPHLLGLPWAFSRRPERFRRITWGGIVAVGVAGLLFGAGSWLWLLLR